MIPLFFAGPSHQLAWSQGDHGEVQGPAWLRMLAAVARNGRVQLSLVLVSLLWLVISLLRVYRNRAGKMVPHRPRGSLIYEYLSHILRGTTLALFVIAASRSSRQWPNAVASGYILVLGILRVPCRGDNRKVFLHHINAVAFCTLVLSAFADVLPLVAIRTTFHPQTMTIAALVSLFCLNYVAAKTPREWMPPTQDLNLPEGITVGPTVGETCSWLDYYATFSRVDRLFRKGWKDSLTMKELDDIPWSYIPEILRRRFSDLRTKHVRTGKTLVIMLWPKLVFVTAAAILLFMAELIAPFCLYQLLEYLRAPEEATLQPYLWLVVMFSGRMLHGLIQQTFAFTSRKIAIYVKLMLTGDVYQTALQSRELEGSFLKNPEEQDDDDDGKEGPEGSSTGMLENLISSDVDTIMNFRMFLWAVSSVPSAVIAVCGLYSIVGWPCFIGLLVMVSSTPVATFLMTYVTKYEEKLKTAQDARISLASEYLRSIKVIKYFGWEDSVVDKICKARDTEQKHLWTVDMLYIGTMEMAYLFPILSLLIVFGLYVGVEKLPLTAPVAYTTITLLATVRDNLAILASVSMNLPKALVSLKRFDRFFAAATPLDIYPHGPARIDNATFRRTETADFRLYNISIDFIQNGLTVIKGISGSGKTSLLLALLGETVKESGTVTRQRDAAFVSQSSWLQALTVRENIIFNSPNDDERYRKVVEACCLDVDFEELQKGDETNIGENGTALSGGQRARVALARALYSNSSLLLLDDIFSALDTKTSLTLWNRVFCSDILKKRTVILVTQLSWIANEADLEIVLENGSIKSKEQNLGHVRNPKVVEIPSGEESAQDGDAKPKTNGNSKKVPTKSGAVTPTESEDLAMVDQEAASAVGGFSFYKYMLYFGGPIIAILTTSTLFLNSGAEVLTNYWMSRWVDNTDKDTTSDASYYLWIYIGLTFLTEMIEGVKFYAFIRGSWFAAKRLHGELIRAVMDVSLDWFRTNPVGRVINRLSGDISTLDQDLVNSVIFLLGATIRCLFMGGTVTAILPVFFVPAIVLCVVGGLISIVYNRTAGLLKQLVSSSQSPVLSDFSEGLGGMMVIRAMNKMPGVFSAKMNRLLYTSARATVAQIDTEQWLKFRINTLAALINVSAALLALMQRDKISAGLAGFCLSQATTLSDMILYIVFDISDLNIQMQAFHRVREYGQLEPEEKSAEKQQNPEAYSDNVERAISPNWPSSGTVEFRNVTIRYSEDGPDVLRNINLKFNAGERVAVVGRTGSGKSTLILSILRFTNVVSGQIFYDGVDITALPRKQLRQAISMIPQEAQLFQGTIASNLDPTGAVPEAHLQKALDICQSMAAMKATEPTNGSNTEEDEENGNASNANFTERLSLATTVNAKGENFSHGQRQVLSLCRILVRRSKLMLLDEATSSMDMETDEAIQKALRDEFSDDEGKTRCLITIAHRLQTISDYDKVVVMGSGEVLEHGSPAELMTKKGHFYDMWLHSNEEDTPSRSVA